MLNNCNTSPRPTYSGIMTESTILFLYENLRVREIPYSSIFYALYVTQDESKLRNKIIHSSFESKVYLTHQEK